MPIMDIFSEPGTRVIFDRPNNGTKYDKDNCAEFLALGAFYTIEKTEVGDYSTRVFLREIPGRWFNSVMFSNAE